MNIKGIITSAKFVKSGQGVKGPWSMFEVVIAGQKFTSFDTNIQGMIGQEGVFEYTERPWTDKQGNEHIGKTLVNPKKLGGNLALKEINDKLDKILSIVSNEPQMPDAEEPTEINTDDIPF